MTRKRNKTIDGDFGKQGFERQREENEKMFLKNIYPLVFIGNKCPFKQPPQLS